MNHEIRVVAILRAKPGRAAELEPHLKACVVPSRAEPGCREYILHVDQADPERFGQQDGDQGWQAGPRLHIGKNLDIDLVAGQHLSGDHDRWFTTGATVRF